jgi:hypothetical protein
MGELAGKYKQVFFDKLKDDPDQSYAIVNYMEDFARFWKLDLIGGNIESVFPAVTSNRHGQNALIIIWDDLPKESGTVELSTHLTPLDWALAFSIKTGGGNFPFGIHIIDLTLNRFEKSFAMQMASSLCEAMPWVKLYAPLPRGRRAYEEKFPLDLLQSGKWPCIDNQTNKISRNLLDRQKRLNLAWQAWVVRSRDHHDLNNIIGPRVIAEMLDDNLFKMDSGKNVDMVSAILTRLFWTGLIERQDIKASRQTLPDLQSVEVKVFDDQLSNDWDRVLCALFHVKFIPVAKHASDETLPLIGMNKDSVMIYGTENPDIVLKDLGISSSSTDDKAVDVESFTKRHVGAKPFILVLDLYLFSGKPVEDIRKWYKTLASAALQITKLHGLAWPGFAEIEQIEHLAKTGFADETCLDTALSLLPRLCALKWPSVPIMIFSATRRPGLITKLADYGNIFLSSPKPDVLAGDARAQVAVFVANWYRDIMAAQRLLEVQKHLIDLERIQHKSSSLWNDAHTHLVIAFDETGDFKQSTESAVGGVILFTKGENEKDAIEKSFEVQERFRKNGVNFYSRTPYYPDADKSGEIISIPTIAKKTEVAKKVTESLATFPDIAKLAAFCIWIDKNNYSKENEYKDGSYLRGLASCIELIACDLLPLGQADEKITIAWWFPTKITGFIDKNQLIAAETEAYNSAINDHKTREEAELNKKKAHKQKKNQQMPIAMLSATIAAKKYDYRYQEEDRVETVGYGHAYSMVVQVLSQRNNFSSIMRATKSFRSRAIPYDHDEDGNEKNNTYFQCINDRADHNCKDKTPFVPKKYHHLNKGYPQCSHCSRKDTVRAEYSVLSHLADAVLSPVEFPNEKAMEKILNSEISFEVQEGPLLNDFIQVSRLIDAGRLKDAFKLAFHNDFFVRGIMKPGTFAKVHLQQGVQTKLKEYARTIPGNVIIELAGLSLRYSVENYHKT